jgi:beta-galactosidase
LNLIGDKRPQSFYRDIVWGQNDGPHIFALPPKLVGKKINHTDWAWLPVEQNFSFPGEDGKDIEVHVYARADEVELLLDGESIGKVAISDDNPFTAIFKFPYRPGKLEAISYKNGEIIGKSSLETVARTDKLVLEAEQKELCADGAAIFFVNISAVDSNGNINHGENGTVKLMLSGGEILAAGSGNPMPDEKLPFGGENVSQVNLFEGRALVAIRCDKECDIELSVQAEKGHSAALNIPAVSAEKKQNIIIRDLPLEGISVPIGVLMEDEKAAKVLNAALVSLGGQGGSAELNESLKNISLYALAGIIGDKLPSAVLEGLANALADFREE